MTLITDTDQLVWGENLTPWAGLGTVVPNLLSTQEALKLSGLDWTVRLDGLTTDKGLKVPGKFASVREDNDTVLGVVGSDYKVINNTDAFSMMDAMFDTGENFITSAGSMYGGSQVFLTAKIGDTFTVAGDDAHDSYLLMSTRHDGTGSFTAAVTTIRLSCANMVTMALSKAKNKWSITHRSTLEGKTQEAMESLGLVHKYESAFQDEVEKLLAVEMEKDTFVEMMKDVLPKQKRQLEKNIDELVTIWENEPTNPQDNTGWKALNTVTYWTDHKEYRTPDARFKTITGGFASNLRNNVHKRVLAHA